MHVRLVARGGGGEIHGGDAPGPGVFRFPAGGHSLLATQVVSRIRDIFGVSLPLQAFSKTPMIAALAVAVEAGKSSAESSAIPKLERPSSRENLLDRLDQLSKEQIDALLKKLSGGGG